MPDLADRVRALLADQPDVVEKRMFGALGFMVNGKLCVTARSTRIMCRIDPAEHDAAVAEDGCKTVVMGGRTYRGYVQVGADAVRTRRSLQRWVDRALAFNATLAGVRRGRSPRNC